MLSTDYSIYRESLSSLNEVISRKANFRIPTAGRLSCWSSQSLRLVPRLMKTICRVYPVFMTSARCFPTPYSGGEEAKSEQSWQELISVICQNCWKQAYGAVRSFCVIMRVIVIIVVKWAWESQMMSKQTVLVRCGALIVENSFKWSPLMVLSVFTWFVHHLSWIRIVLLSHLDEWMSNIADSIGDVRITAKGGEFLSSCLLVRISEHFSRLCSG